MFEALTRYIPINEQEEKDKQLILNFIERNPDILSRDNLSAHLTSSAIILNESFEKVLFIHHNIYNSWGWVGGHNDGDADCLRVSLKEAKEETGIESVRPYRDDILGLDVIYVSNHVKNGQYVPDHLHLNITYLFIADEEEQTKVKPDENSGVKWFGIEEIFSHIDEERMKPVYKKLIDRALIWKEEQR
ncbi:MAG: NUDIX hydrolase [Bacilli bacterium]|nr:NUDIX hydrolase [Bacilli bacterium]MBN2696309.1 NUDIX hydrolase [Bacilli bacterium]